MGPPRGHQALGAVGTEGEVGVRSRQLLGPGLGWQRLGQAALSASSLGLQGASWLHVGTDQPFASVSIGGCCQVWAVARDGSAFYRGSVSPSKPAGECRLSWRGGLSARLSAGRLLPALASRSRSEHVVKAACGPAAGTARVPRPRPCPAAGGGHFWVPCRSCPPGHRPVGPLLGWPRSAHSKVATPRRTA